jgi:hypothetical protein
VVDISVEDRCGSGRVDHLRVRDGVLVASLLQLPDDHLLDRVGPEDREPDVVAILGQLGVVLAAHEGRLRGGHRAAGWDRGGFGGGVVDGRDRGVLAVDQARLAVEHGQLARWRLDVLFHQNPLAVRERARQLGNPGSGERRVVRDPARQAVNTTAMEVRNPQIAV